MRKTWVLFMVLMFLTTSITAAIGNREDFEETRSDAMSTHTVLAEEGTATWCPYCSPVAGYLHTLYNSGEYDFYYVALVYDKNGKAAQRCDDLGLTGFPTVFFDGGYTKVIGDQGLQPIKKAIENSGKRHTRDVVVDVKSRYLGNYQMEVSVEVINNEAITYKGRVRVYVTEHVSRWNTNNGDPYHFALLDFAVNEDVIISSGSSFEKTVVWNGENYGIDPENIAIIGAIFDSDDLVDNADKSSAFPDTTIVSGPTGEINYQNVTFEWIGEDDFTPTGELLYSYKLEPYDDDWSPWASNTTVTYYNLPEGIYTFQVKTKNSDGNIDPVPAALTFSLNKNIPPKIEIVKPLNGLYVRNKEIMKLPFTLIIGDVDIETEIDDTAGIDKVDFYVDGHLVISDFYAPYRCTVWHEQGLFKKHVIEVIAYDLLGNNDSVQINVWKVF